MQLESNISVYFIFSLNLPGKLQSLSTELRHNRTLLENKETKNGIHPFKIYVKESIMKSLPLRFRGASGCY